MIIIGNKPYDVIQLDNIIDMFGKNIRLNFGLENNNNGTKRDILFLNVHVYDNLMINKNVDRYINDVSSCLLNEFFLKFDKKTYSQIIRQNNTRAKTYNAYLKNIGCPYIFTVQPRVGCNALFEILLSNYNKKLYLANFSLTKDENKKHLYSTDRVLNKDNYWHNYDDEANIIIWLHNNTYIDATLCSLIDTKLPTLNCLYIKPSWFIIKLLLNQYGICILHNYYNDKELTEMVTEFDECFLNYTNNVEILDKEGCSNDERIFHAEKYCKVIREKFSDNKLFNNCAITFKKILQKKTLINRIIYEEGKIKNSGAGWHRDNHNCQFKAIMYITDVTCNNGNFQFLTNSSRKYIDYPTSRTVNSNTRFSDKTINELLDKHDSIKLHNIVGKKGTIIMIDTTYIHREKIIEEGERKEIITQYFS